jgi:hypothetical protein
MKLVPLLSNVVRHTGGVGFFPLTGAAEWLDTFFMCNYKERLFYEYFKKKAFLF